MQSKEAINAPLNQQFHEEDQLLLSDSLIYATLLRAYLSYPQKFLWKHRIIFEKFLGLFYQFLYSFSWYKVLLLFYPCTTLFFQIIPFLNKIHTPLNFRNRFIVNYRKSLIKRTFGQAQ